MYWEILLGCSVRETFSVGICDRRERERERKERKRDREREDREREDERSSSHLKV
jgi:hypothetical protein